MTRKWLAENPKDESLSTRFVLKDVLRLCLRLDQLGKETMTSLAVRAKSATADATNATLFGSIEL